MGSTARRPDGDPADVKLANVDRDMGKKDMMKVKERVPSFVRGTLFTVADTRSTLSLGGITSLHCTLKMTIQGAFPDDEDSHRTTTPREGGRRTEIASRRIKKHT